MADQDGVNIPISSSFDAGGTDAAGQSYADLGARLRELQAEEAKAAAPVAPPVSVPGAPAAEQALRRVGDAGDEAGKRTKESLSEADQFVHTLTEHASSLGGAFKAGLGIGAAEGVLSALEGVREKLAECLTEGIEVNKEFETLGIGLASSLRQADPAQFSDFNKALEASGTLIDSIKQKALSLNLDAAELGHNVQVNMLSLVEGGITDLNAQVETTGLLMQAAAAKGITGFQAVRDVIDILNGRAQRVILSRELGITNEDIAQAKKAGDLAGYLADKLSAYREAAAATRDTLAGLQQQESTLGKNLEGQLSAGLFADAKANAQGMVQALNSPEVHEAAQVFSQILGDLGSIEGASGDVLRLVSLIAIAAAAIADPLAVVTSHINAATAESDNLGRSIASGTRALQDQLQSADTLEKKAASRAAIEDALAGTQAKADAQRRAGNGDNAALLDQQATLLEHMLGTFDQTAGKVVSIGTHEESRKATMEAQQKLLEGQLATVEKIGKTLADRAKKDDLDNATPQDLQARINAQLLNARDLIKQGGLELPYDLTLDPESILKFRDQLHAASSTAEAQAAFEALKVKISETALSISDLEKAHDKAGAAADKEAATAAKDADKMIADRRKFIDALGDEETERGELAKRQQELRDAQGATDAASEAGQKRIKDAVEQVTKAQQDLQKAEADRQAAQAKAFPDELARLKQIADQLRGMVTGEADAAKEALITERNLLQNTVNGKSNGPAPLSNDAVKRITGDVDASGKPTPGPISPDLATPPPGTADPGPPDDNQSPPSDRDASGTRAGDPGYDAGTDPDAGADSSLADTASSTDDAAGSLADAANQSSTAAATLSTQAGQVQEAIGNVSEAHDQYHQAVFDGLNGLAANVSSIISSIQSLNQTIASQGQDLAQVQLQVDNIGDSDA